MVFYAKFRPMATVLNTLGKCWIVTQLPLCAKGKKTSLLLSRDSTLQWEGERVRETRGQKTKQENGAGQLGSMSPSLPHAILPAKSGCPSDMGRSNGRHSVTPFLPLPSHLARARQRNFLPPLPPYCPLRLFSCHRTICLLLTILCSLPTYSTPSHWYNRWAKLVILTAPFPISMKKKIH